MVRKVFVYLIKNHKTMIFKKVNRDAKYLKNNFTILTLFMLQMWPL